MNANPDVEPLLRSGWWARAEYQPQEIPSYRGNPRIEALPRIFTKRELAKGLGSRPEYREEERELPAEVRQHATVTVLSFVRPLSIHTDLANKISRLIRNGYVARNPVLPRYRTDLEAGLSETIRRNPGPRSTGMSLSGLSGVGKSTALEAILAMYPQVIEHVEYEGKPHLEAQVVHLTLQCPPDSSVRALCLRFVRALDDLLGENYTRDYVRTKTRTPDLIDIMKRLASIHGLGLLVIDETQHLATAKSGGERVLLNTLTELVNSIGVPVVLVGTPKMLDMLKKEFRHLRRGTGQGEVHWDRMRRDTPADEAEWKIFCEAMWKYQYVRTPSPLTPEILDTLYFWSQGITDVVCKLYVLVQDRAIAAGHERITPGMIKSVATDSLGSLQEVLQALRQNRRIAGMDDLLADGLSRIVNDGFEATRVMTSHAAPASASDGGKRKGRRNARAAVTATGPGPRPGPDRVREAPTAKAGETLMDIVQAGAAARQTPYDALREAGLIAEDGPSV